MKFLILLPLFILLSCYHIPKDEFDYPLRPYDITEKPTTSSAFKSASGDLRNNTNFLTLSKQVKFENASSKLNPSSAKILSQIADEIKSNPHSFSKLRIMGFADRTGSASNNLRLSQFRADNVRKYLISKGVPADKLEALGMGSLSSEQDIMDKSQIPSDRRVDFEIVQ